MNLYQPMRSVSIRRRSAIAMRPNAATWARRGRGMTGTRALGLIAIVTALILLPAVSAHSEGISAIAIDPVTPTTVYAGTRGGGVFKSTNSGANWSPSGLADTYVWALAIARVTATTTVLYAAAGDTRNGKAGGLYMSTNGGVTWSDTGAANDDVTAIAIDPVTPTTLYAGTWGAVLKSIDGGANWSTSSLAGLVSSVVIDPMDSGILYAGTTRYTADYYQDGPLRGGVYKSIDRGLNWNPAVLYYGNEGWFFKVCGPCGGVVALAVDPLIPAIFGVTDALTEMDYFGEYLESSPGNLIKGSDGGMNWLAVPGAPGPGTPALALAPPVNTVGGAYTLYYVGNLDLFKSTDGGANWSAAGLSGGVSSVAIDPMTPTTLYAGQHDNAVYRSTNGGETWTRTGPIPWFYVSSLTLNPVFVVEESSSVGTVTLSAPAPAEGAEIALTSSNAAVAPVPVSVTVPAGATSADFTISTNPLPDPGSIWVYITALYGSAGRGASMGVASVPPLSTLSLHPASVTGGSASTGTVTLSAAAPSRGAVVTLSSSNTAAATVPVSVTVPAGGTTATFTVATSSVTTSTTTVTITAIGGGPVRTAQLTVTPPPPPVVTLASLSLTPIIVDGVGTSTGTVTLSATGGAVVTLSSSNTAAATVPASVSVPSTSTTATFPVTTKAVTTSTTVTITATLGGATRTATLTVNPPPPAVTLASLTLQPTSVKGGSPSTGTIRLSAKAPSGGVIVTLSSSQPSIAAVPISITVPAGTTSATFTVSTRRPGSNSTNVTISAELANVLKSTTLTVKR